MEALFTWNFALSCLFIALAAICNSIMDTIAHHWHISVFRAIKNDAIREWFGGKELWFDTFDGWHTAKRGMLLFFFLAIHSVFITPLSVWMILLIIAIYSTIWSLIFLLFYDIIWITKSAMTPWYKKDVSDTELFFLGVNPEADDLGYLTYIIQKNWVHDEKDSAGHFLLDRGEKLSYKLTRNTKNITVQIEYSEIQKTDYLEV